MCLLPLRVATDPCPGAMSSKVAEDPSDADVTAFLTATREGRVESALKLADVVGVNSFGTLFVEEVGAAVCSPHSRWAPINVSLRGRCRQRQRTTTALYEAVDTNNAELVDKLMALAGADVNVQPVGVVPAPTQAFSCSRRPGRRNSTGRPSGWQLTKATWD